MRREPPVRIREGLGVKFPRATRLVICCRGTADEAMTRDAGDDVQAETDGERDEDAIVPPAG